jgi:hypothetical protein
MNDRGSEGLRFEFSSHRTIIMSDSSGLISRLIVLRRNVNNSCLSLTYASGSSLRALYGRVWLGIN